MSITVIQVNEDVRDFAARQFAREFDSGASVADAAARLRSALPEQFRWSVAEIETLFAGGESPRMFPQLAGVLATARAHGAKPEATFAAFERAARSLRPSLTAALSGATSFGAYLVSLLLLLAIVVSIYAIFVLPQFQSMFDMFGTPLPLTTRALMGNNWILVPALALMLMALVFYFTGLQRLKRRMLTLQPLRPILRWIPGLAGWARTYDTGLWLHYQAIFLDAGLDPAAAASAAALHAGEPADGDHRLRLLESGANLGRLREELAEQLERDRQASLEQFEQPRNVLVILIRAIVYLIVGFYVMAMYLPIFKLGAIV